MSCITQIQDVISREDCQKILRRSTSSQFQITSHKITKFSEGAAGFLADHLLLTIHYITNNAPTHKTYFVKTTPIFNKDQLSYVLESGIFRKELLLYRNLLTELLSINHFGPNCYLVKDNCVVLEDLCAKGYRMLPKVDYLNVNCMENALKNLAKYHASTIVYEESRGVRIGEKYTDEIKETCFSFVEGQPRYKWCVCCTRCVMDLIELMPEYQPESEVLDWFHKFVFERMPGLLQPSEKYRNVLTHDDLWVNNMLFNDRKECIFVDFQLVRYTPPALDFLLIVYLNLPHEYVDKNLRKLANFYYTNFVKELERNDLNRGIVPWEEFTESFEIYKMPALTEAAMYGTHVYISEDLSNSIIEDTTKYNEFSFINRSKFACEEFVKNPKYQERLRNVLIPLLKQVETLYTKTYQHPS